MTTAWVSTIFGPVLFLAYALTSCYGLYLLKVASSVKSLVFLSGLLLYVAGAGIWMVILRTFPLSVAFPIAAGTLVIGTSLMGALFLSEGLSSWKLAGAGMIIVGIAFVALAE